MTRTFSMKRSKRDKKCSTFYNNKIMLFFFSCIPFLYCYIKSLTNSTILVAILGYRFEISHLTFF